MTSNKKYCLFLLSLIALASGCAEPCADKLIRCQNENLKLKEEFSAISKHYAASTVTINEQNKQIANFYRFRNARYVNLAKMKEIQIDRLTAAADTNNDGCDDTVNVYFRPVDVRDHVIKAPGEVIIRLFDLSEKPAKVGEIRLTAEMLETHWIGRLITNHYSLQCPITKNPGGSNITLRIEFTELLTGRIFTAEKMLTAKSPPAAKK
jgi:hypothetical protein